MVDLNPLPRSLDPLPDEILPGYLLRLSHRLARPPARILQLTGLAGQGSRFPCRTSHELMIRLDTDTRETFARMTRMTPGEADALCLGSFAPRYPLTAVTDWSKSRTQRVDWWFFTTSTRYCPECLAGDSSPVQQAHGGPWRRSWRLPVVFACIQHRQLLQHRCPACRRPAHDSPYDTSRARMPLLQGLKISGLHPAQCRSHPFGGTAGVTQGVPSACGSRLDQHHDSGIELPEAALTIQRRLLDLLDPEGPSLVVSAGEQTDPAGYFSDLRMLAVLIGESWPRARHLMLSTDLADAFDLNIAQRNAQPRQQPGLLAHARQLDPAVSAALLTAADRILTQHDTSQVRHAIQQLLPITRFSEGSGWRHHFLRYFSAESKCSPGLRNAVIPLVQAFPKLGPRTRRAAELRTSFGPEHIPQHLPDQWFDRHLGHLDDAAAPRTLRRTTAVRLVQMIVGGSLGDAAQYLGIPTSTDGRYNLYGNGAGTIRWARSRPDPDEFDAALRALAAELNTATGLVNYRERRVALQNWSMDPATWHEILTNSEACTTRIHQSADRLRQIASILVWARVTSGELTFAPRALQDQQPLDIQRSWSHCLWPRAWTTLKSDQPKHHLAKLKEAINSYADQLGATIDADRQTLTTHHGDK